MPENEDPTASATTEIPQVQAAPAVPAAPAAVVAPAPVTAKAPVSHSTMKVLLGVGAGALVVFLIAAAGILGFAIGKHANHAGGIRPPHLAQMQGHFGGQGGQGGQFGPGSGRGPGMMQGQQGQQGQQGLPGMQGQQGLPGMQGQQGLPGMQGQQGGSQSSPQGQRGTMPQLPGQSGQSSGGMMGQWPAQ